MNILINVRSWNRERSATWGNIVLIFEWHLQWFEDGVDIQQYGSGVLDNIERLATTLPIHVQLAGSEQILLLRDKHIPGVILRSDSTVVAEPAEPNPESG